MCRSAAEGGRRCRSTTKAREAAHKQRQRLTRRVADVIAAVLDGEGDDRDIEPWGVKLAAAEERVQATSHRAAPPDRLRQLTEDTFQDGQCHALALALHERTGWPVWALRSPGRNGHDVHFVVRAPDGRLVDVTGARDVAAVEADPAWVGCTAIPSSAGFIKGLVASDRMEVPLMDLARAVLPQVLAKAERDGT